MIDGGERGKIDRGRREREKIEEESGKGDRLII